MSLAGRVVDVALDVLPLYGQIEIGDRDASDVPQWEIGEESAIANEEMVCVATRPDVEGVVHLSVISEGTRDPEGDEIFAGELLLPTGVLAVGNSVAAQVREIDLSPVKTLLVRVFTAPRESPSRVTVVLA